MRDVECTPWPIARCVVSVAICVVRVVGMTVRFEVSLVHVGVSRKRE
jgi:hypothetical protein